MELKYKIWLDNNGKVFGEGPYHLLRGIQSTGSLSQAAKQMNMSYSCAHNLMKNLGKNLGYPLIESQAGGSGGGLTIITLQGEAMMKAYDAFMHECDIAIQSNFNKHFKHGDFNFSAVASSGKYKSKLIKTLGLKRGDVITLSGGGGKTSIMFTLGEELALSGYKVAIVTTTLIYFPNHGSVDRLLVFEEKELVSRVAEAAGNSRILALGTGVQNAKLMAVSPKFIDKLAQSKLVDFILVEADGASRKPFKAPKPTEPVIPGCTTLALTIAGVDALGIPLHAHNVHRPEYITKLTGLKEGDIITPKAMADVLSHSQGGRKEVPPGVRWCTVINKVDNRSNQTAANKIAAELRNNGVEEIFFSSTLGGALRIKQWQNRK